MKGWSTPPRWLPDFCHGATLLEVVVLGELLALVLALLPGGPAAGFWPDLGLYSLFIQWVALSGVALLCLLRPQLLRLPPRWAALWSFALLMALITAVSSIGHWLYGAATTPTLDFTLRAVAIGALVSAVGLRYLGLQQRWRQQLAAAQRARLEALQARIRPHFLFNALNTIASLVPERPAQAETLLLDLAGVLRSSLNAPPLHGLDDELALTRAYLNLEQQRLGERLRVVWSLPSPLPALQVPPLTLQPLVENAVRHGIEPLPGGGEVRIEVRREAAGVVVAVENPLPAVAAAEGNGLGLDNVRERLLTVFGTVARLWQTDQGGHYRVELWLPLAEGG